MKGQVKPTVFLNIDMVFIINLEKRKDRKLQIIQQMKQQNIQNYTFFKAFCPNFEEVKNWNPKYLADSTNQSPNYKIGCLGCLMSHLGVMKISLHMGYKRILILEDDTIFCDNISKLSEYVKQINNTYDMLYLNGSHLRDTTQVSQNIVRVCGTHTTGSYVITEPVMRYIIDNINHYPKEVDVFLAEQIQPRFNCFCVTPHLTTQDDGFSDIQNTNVTYKLTEPCIRRYQYTQEWFINSEIKSALLTHIRQKDKHRVLEIGCFEGLSACFFSDTILAHSESSLDCVDPFYITGTKEGITSENITSETESRFKDNIAKSTNSRKISFFKMTSDEFFSGLDDSVTYDFIYIDGCHEPDFIRNDINNSFRVIVEGGVIWMDDYGGGSPPGTVREVIDTELEKKRKQYEFEIIHKNYQLAIRVIKKL